MSRPRTRTWLAALALALPGGCAAHPKAAPATAAATGSRGSAGGAAKNVAPHQLDLQAIDRPDPRLPDKVRAAHAGQQVTLMYYITVGADGDVVALDPVVSSGSAEAWRTVADVDAVVEETVRRWRFKTQPIPIRSMIRFVFVIVPARP